MLPAPYETHGSREHERGTHLPAIWSAVRASRLYSLPGILLLAVVCSGSRDTTLGSFLRVLAGPARIDEQQLYVLIIVDTPLLTPDHVSATLTKNTIIAACCVNKERTKKKAELTRREYTQFAKREGERREKGREGGGQGGKVLLLSL